MRKRELFIKEKLLIVIYEMSLEQKSILKYEDLYVTAFEKYPIDFQLRGYPQHLDTELMSKKLYDLKKNGLIQVQRKFVTITEKGKSLAEQLINAESSPNNEVNKLLTRDVTNQIDRIKNSDAYRSINDKKDQIVDTDFFNYLGATVRTERTDSGARIKTIMDIVATIKINDEYKLIVDLHDFLFDKFNDLIKAKLSIGFPRRKHA